MVIPVSQHQDTVGPLARTVKDAAKVLQSIAGADPNDNYTQASPYGNDLPDYAATCKPSGLKGKRIGVPQNVIAQWATDDNAAVRSAFDKAVSTMSEAGAIIIDDTNFTAYDNYTSSPAPQEVVAIDFKSDIAEYISNLKTNPNKIYDLADISNFTKHNPLEDYPSRNIETWNLVLGVPINNTSPEFWAMYQQNLYFGGEGGVLGAISRHKLDAVILPTAIGFQIPALVGSPAITVPLGSMPDGSPIRKNARGDLVESAPGIPFGISFLGELWSEEMLIEMAYAFEQRTLHRGKIHHYIEPKAELKNNK